MHILPMREGSNIAVVCLLHNKTSTALNIYGGEYLGRLGVVELAGEGDELLLLGLLPRERAAAGLGAGGEVDLLEGVVGALRGRVGARDGRVREHGWRRCEK